MATRLLDTNIVSFMLRNDPLQSLYLPHLQGYDRAISFQTLAELIAGALLANWGTARFNALEALIKTMRVLDSDRSTCDYWGLIGLHRKSQPIPVSDCWIAATAMAYKLELVTHNPIDFANIPGLVVITESP